MPFPQPCCFSIYILNSHVAFMTALRRGAIHSIQSRYFSVVLLKPSQQARPMSPNRPTTTQPDDHAIYYLGRVGQRTQMTKAHETPHVPPILPLPSQLAGMRPQLPPLSNLSGSTRLPPSPVQYSPHVLLGQPQSSFATMSPHEQTLTPAAPASWPNPPQQIQPGQPVSSFPHPALYPQRASFQSKNPGTVYEALSPVEYSSGRPTSLFNEASYNQSPPYPSWPVSTFQSPTSSHRSSTTSSSGATSIEGSSRFTQYNQAIPQMVGSGPDFTNIM